MIPISVFVIVILVLLGLNYYVYQYAKKKGVDAFMTLLFEAGFANKTDAFKAYNAFAKPGGIVFLGDSITQDFNVYEYFPNQTVYNRGIGGDTSKGVINRLDESVFDLKPAKVFIQIGTNDFELIGDSVDAIYQRIKEIVSRIKTYDQSIQLYLISVYPVNPHVDPMTVGKRNNQDICVLNQMLENIDGVTYVNLYDKLEKNGVLNPEYTVEGLHLNQKGYRVVINELNQYI